MIKRTESAPDDVEHYCKRLHYSWLQIWTDMPLVYEGHTQRHVGRFFGVFQVIPHSAAGVIKKVFRLDSVDI